MFKQQMMGNPQMMTTKMNTHAAIGMEIFMFVILALIVAAIVLVCYYIYKNRSKLKDSFSAKDSSDSKDISALEMLNRKFVNGEITEEEYLKKKELIK